MANTLLLDRSSWDCCADAAGNIAVATEPYSIVQDVASACRLFRDELWYGGNRGVPYFGQILGQYRPVAVLKEYLRAQAMGVQGVLSATVYLSEIEGRVMSGQIHIVTANGMEVVAI